MPKALPGLNVYARYNPNQNTVVPHFSEFIDALCYPMIFLFGKVWFKPSTIPLGPEQKTPKKTKKKAAREFFLCWLKNAISELKQELKEAQESMRQLEEFVMELSQEDEPEGPSRTTDGRVDYGEG